MTLLYPPKIIAPSAVYGSGQTGDFPFDQFDRAYLAQGDSWFSFGAIPPTLTSNVLEELELARHCVIVNCARPGMELQHMADTSTEQGFLRLLTGKVARRWNGILFSGMGNDLIDAATVGPGAPAALRLFRTAAERGAGPLTGDAYLSTDGWATFADHMKAVLQGLLRLRDSGVNRRVPLLLHNYARLMPRPAPAGLGFGPWLAPSLTAFAVPATDWLAVADALMTRLDGLLRGLVQTQLATDPASALQVVDTRSAALVLADPGSTGASGDYVNEIHPTRGGYAKLAAVWGTSIDALP